MAAARRAVPTHTTPTGIPGDVAELIRVLRAMIDPYRPEQHYMRGPGPKWHAKHDPAPAAQNIARIPELAHIKG